ncbi:hypothetical protein LXM94_16635 [Rhizobium sp. TRM95111]|uniref:hypothetical protein n=1 Tax=Rhizobium alarense TaxID=2846851 RepID=UPI001F450F59|nr:hypothetical protein [Rhizobium alarense]MCF3641601.1 hypothetical protein [Rhizobium alarense]
MAVDSVNFDADVKPLATGGDETSGGGGVAPASATRKVDPNSDEELLNAAVESFVPGMISNTLTLNNSLFNFAKEAIDEADES